MVFGYVVGVIVLTILIIIWIKGVIKCLQAKQWLMGLFAIVVPLFGFLLYFFDITHIAKMMPSVPTEVNDKKCCWKCRNYSSDNPYCPLCGRYKPDGPASACGCQRPTCSKCESKIRSMPHYCPPELYENGAKGPYTPYDKGKT